MTAHYFVLDKNKKILGFNLDEKAKNKLFYNTSLSTGQSEGRGYGATFFKTKDEKELQTVLDIRHNFKNCSLYSYVILTDSNHWVATGSKESEEVMLHTLIEAQKEYPENKIVLFETTDCSVTI